jgi:hypothetical protein
MLLKIVLISFWSFMSQKATWLTSMALSMIVAFFLPIETYIFCAFMACFADAVVGIASAAKRGEGFDGKKIRESLIKLLLYVTVTSAFYHISFSLRFPINITYFVVSMISVAELMSILRNLGDYTGFDYESKVREHAPFLADFLPKSKNIHINQ